MGAIEDLIAQIDKMEASKDARSVAIKYAADRTAGHLVALSAEIAVLRDVSDDQTNPDLSGMTGRVVALATGLSSLIHAAATIDPSTPDPEPLVNPPSNTPTPTPPVPPMQEPPEGPSPADGEQPI